MLISILYVSVAFVLAAVWAVIVGLKGKGADAPEDILMGTVLAAAWPAILGIVVVCSPFYFFWKLGRGLR